MAADSAVSVEAVTAAAGSVPAAIATGEAEAITVRVTIAKDVADVEHVIRNPNGLADQYRRWWGFEGGSAGAAVTWNVPSSHLLGFETRPRLGDDGYLDVFLDMPQPLLCLSARLVLPTADIVTECVSPYQYSDLTARIRDSLPFSYFYVHSYVSLASSDSFLLTVKLPFVTPGAAAFSLSLNDDPVAAGTAVQVTGSPVSFQIAANEIVSVALVAPTTLEAGLTLVAGLSAQDRYSNAVGEDAPVPGRFRVDLLAGPDNATVASCSSWEYVAAWTCTFDSSPTAADTYHVQLVPTSGNLSVGASQLESRLQVLPSTVVDFNNTLASVTVSPDTTLLVAGAEVIISITALDAYGHIVTAGDPAFQLDCANCSQLLREPPTPLSPGTTRFTVSYTAAGTSTHRLLLNSTAQTFLEESVTISAANATLSQSRFSGPTFWRAGESAVFEFEPFDAYGNPAPFTAGSSERMDLRAVMREVSTAGVAEGQELEVPAVLREDALAYAVSVPGTLLNTSGQYYAAVQLHTLAEDRMIRSDAELRQLVTISYERLGMAQSQLENVFSRAAVGVTSRALVRGVDRFGNFFARNSIAQELGTPAVTPAGPSLLLSDFTRGYAALDFTADSLGTFDVSVQQFGVHVQGSPFTVVVEERLEPDVTQTRTWGSAVDGEPRAGVEHDLYVQLADSSGSLIAAASDGFAADSVQLECVKDDDWLLHVQEFPEEHDLCGPGYPRLESFAGGVWHFKVKYHSFNPQFISNRQQRHPCRTSDGISQAWQGIIEAEWASQDFYSLLPEHACNRASTARLTVSLLGQSVPGSPFQPQFRSTGVVDPSKSLAYYTGTPVFFGFHAGDAALSAVTVAELRDEYGNAYREPPSEAPLFYMPPLRLERDFDNEGREGLLVPVDSCRWYLNWFIWCPFTTTVSGAYSLQLLYRNVSFPLANSPFYPNYDAGTVVHVNAGPPSPRHFTSSGLDADMLPGEDVRGTLQARDSHGNRSPVNRAVAAQGEQYWQERTFLQPSRGPANATQTLDVLHVSASLQDCEAACDYSSAVTATLDGSLPGLVEVAYGFTRPGMYTIVAQYKGSQEEGQEGTAFEDVAGSPWEVKVHLLAPQTLDPLNFADFAVLTAGEYKFLYLQQLDRFGNAAYDPSIQSELQATATHTTGAAAPVLYYLVGYTGELGKWWMWIGGLPAAGLWTLTLSLDGAAVAATPVQVVPAELDLEMSSASGDVGPHFDDGMGADVDRFYDFSSEPLTMAVTARDRFGNEISTGDPGIQLIGQLDNDTVRDTFQRTVSGAVTTFDFAVYRYGTYLWRFETPDGGLVHQCKTHTFQGWNQAVNSYHVGIPATLLAGETMFAGIKVLDKYGWYFHMLRSAFMLHRLYNTSETPLDDGQLRGDALVIEVCP